MRIKKNCKIHGDTDFVLVGKYYKCVKCRNEAVQKCRRNLKSKLVEYKGGKCSICGYDKCETALEFHHLNPSEKDFSISKDGNTRSIKLLQKEVDKCILVCANCHREIHAGIINVDSC